MADVDTILKLVADGVLTAEEADRILSAHDKADDARSAGDRARQLRIEVTERGRRVVNLRVPLNIAGLASAFLPGLPEQDAERIRDSIKRGVRGPIIDIATDDGDRVLIVNE